MSHLTYPNISLREFNDLNIVVARKDIDSVIKVLSYHDYYVDESYLYKKEDEKFLSNNNELTLIKNVGPRNKINVDLHWRFMDKLFFDCELDFLKDTNLLLEVNLQGEKIKTSNCDFLPVLLAMHHGGTELWGRLKYLVDFAFLLDKLGAEIDWKKTKQLAKEKSVYTFILISIALTNKCFKLEIPSELKKDIEKIRIQQAADRRFKDIEKNEKGLRIKSWTFRYWYRVFYKDSNWIYKFLMINNYIKTLMKRYI